MRKFFYLLALCLLPATSFAFPQMIAHGYASCTACHVSPTGGGLMTPYGRSLSKEILSQSSLEGEEGVLYGAIRSPDWMQLGGDVRILQSYVNSTMVEEAKFTVMQADLEVGVTHGAIQAVASIGYQNSMSANSNGSPIISRKHYLQIALSEQDALRVGRFDLAYGIHWPDHFMFSKRDLGWDEGSESYRAEWSRIGEQWQSFVVATIGRPDAPQLRADRALSAMVNYTFLEKNQVGLSAYLGTNALGPRAVLGPTLVVVPLPKLSIFAEVDLQKFMGAQRGQAFGFVETLRANYELFQGVHVYAMQEYSRTDLQQPDRSKEAYTLGLQWFFRPHIEIAAGLRTQKTSPLLGFMDLGWLVFHYYI